jgi:hypothetical protein
VGLGGRTFRLLDDDPGVQRALELFGEDLTPADGAFLQQSDGGDVAEGLHDLYVGVIQIAGHGPEHTQRTYDLAAQPQRKRVYGQEPGGCGLRGELRPAIPSGP